MKKIAVVGLGRFGTSLAIELQRLGCNVLAMDKDEKLVNSLANSISHLLLIDATDKDALIEAGVQSCDTVIVAIGANLETSVVITTVLKELKIQNIIARARDDHHDKILTILGVKSVLLPEKDMGIQLARILIKPEV